MVVLCPYKCTSGLIFKADVEVSFILEEKDGDFQVMATVLAADKAAINHVICPYKCAISSLLPNT